MRKKLTKLKEKIRKTKHDLKNNHWRKKLHQKREGEQVNNYNFQFFLDRYRGKDKADRATAEQVMDKRTRLILFKILSKGIITEINGCISTGKEANVYHATGKDDFDMAVKVGNHMEKIFLYYLTIFVVILCYGIVRLMQAWFLCNNSSCS